MYNPRPTAPQVPSYRNTPQQPVGRVALQQIGGPLASHFGGATSLINTRIRDQINNQQIMNQLESQHRGMAQTAHQQRVGAQGAHATYPPHSQSQAATGFNQFSSRSGMQGNTSQPSILNFGTSTRTSSTVSSSSSLAAAPRPPQDAADNVKMKILPFYDIDSELIKQRPLIATRAVPPDHRAGKFGRVETTLDFSLTMEQCSKISSSKEWLQKLNRVDYGYQLQLRFCALIAGDEKDDEFPPHLMAKLNGRPVQLPPLVPSNYPGQPPKQPSKPLNVTVHAKLRPSELLPNKPGNLLVIQWMPETTTNKHWVVSLNLVKKLTADDLFSRMVDKGYLQSDATRKLIADIMKADENDPDMALTTLKVSVACPVGKSRMQYPCRASTCRHIQCFDAALYLQMNEKKPVWSCPVCNKKILYADISIDQYFVDVMHELSPNSGNDIEINPDGTWKLIEEDKEQKQESRGTTTSKANAGGNDGTGEADVFTIDDSSDDEAGPPPAKKPAISATNIPTPEPSTSLSARSLVADSSITSVPPMTTSTPIFSFTSNGNDDIEVIDLSD